VCKSDYVSVRNGHAAIKAIALNHLLDPRNEPEMSWETPPLREKWNRRSGRAKFHVCPEFQGWAGISPFQPLSFSGYRAPFSEAECRTAGLVCGVARCLAGPPNVRALSAASLLVLQRTGHRARGESRPPRPAGPGGRQALAGVGRATR
jgi:hypothetical protein